MLLLRIAILIITNANDIVFPIIISLFRKISHSRGLPIFYEFSQNIINLN